jgi:hypothetical protein
MPTDDAKAASAEPCPPQIISRDAPPRVCAVRQAQDLSLLALEPCTCNPAQARRCAEEKHRDDFYLEMGRHAAQVKDLQAAAGDFLNNLDDGTTALTWDVAGTDTPFLRRSSARVTWPRQRGEYHLAPAQPWTVLLRHPSQAGICGARPELKREHWRRWKFQTPYTRLLSDRDIGAAFVAMLYLADDLNAAYSRQYPRNVLPYCDAVTLSGRAYQAAAATLTAYYDGECIGVAVMDIAAARIVTEVFDGCLVSRPGKTRPELPDFFIVSKLLDKSEDLRRSSRKVGETYHRDESTIRERFVRRLQAIEARLGKYCKSYNALAYPPQSAGRGWYNIGIDAFPVGSRLVDPPLLAEPQVEPSLKG